MRGNKKDKELTPLQAKRHQEAARDAQIQKALAAARQEERKADHGPTKRRENEYLARYIGLPLHTRLAIRFAGQHQAKSYNLSRQVIGLIDHLFVRYRPPHFLYRAMLSSKGLDLVYGPGEWPRLRDRNHAESIYRDWFLKVARGESFAKASKDVFTKKEAHWFLQAPDGNTIVQNIFWARAAAAGLPRAACDFLVDRFDNSLVARIGDRLADVLRFYAVAWPQMGRNEREEITDFVRSAAYDRAFSFKGRTFGSMRKLSEEWHGRVHAATVREYRSWSCGLPLWQVRSKGQVVRAIELTNNRALADEGRRQKHCVFSYVSHCLRGASRIVSFRWYLVARDDVEPSLEQERVTVEVRSATRQVVQIRGKLNRSATEQEMQSIREWAGAYGLTIDKWAS